MGIPTEQVKDNEPLPQVFSRLAKKVASAYKQEIVVPAEEAIREWLKEISNEQV